MWLPFVLLAVSGGLLGNFADGKGDFVRRGVADPGAESFVRRSNPSVVVLGDYVYIDGGEVSQKVDGSDANTTEAVNSTLSLSLKESWTNETVALRSIPKTAPLLSQQVYWTDAPTGNFYTWGGKATVGPPPESELWRFGVDNAGGGEWSQVAQQDFADFSRLVRPIGSAFTQGGDVGYALGGQATSQTDGAIQKDEPGYALPGLVSYDFRSGQWANGSSAAYEGYGTSLNARAEHVPFGPHGLLLFLGGAETPVDAGNDTIVQLNWNSLALHDPVAGTWFAQATTGARPPTMERACTVGVRGPDNTYEIFIYGGLSDQTHGTSSDVHVLSLPGFVFFKSADGASTPRLDHACVVVGRGRRQMLSVGGTDCMSGNASSHTTPDPLARGLGVYDMTEMRWTGSYEPEAADYASPAVVRGWYAGGGMDGVAWDSDEVKKLFVNGTSTPYGDDDVDDGTDESPGSSTSTDGPLGGAGSTQRTMSSTGAIVGGTVGGVVGLTIVSAVAFVMVRRRRGRPAAPSGFVDDGIAEYRPEPWPKDLPRSRWQSPTSELTDQTAAAEVCDTSRRELPGPELDWTYELPAPLESRRPELPDRKYTT